MSNYFAMAFQFYKKPFLSPRIVKLYCLQLSTTTSVGGKSHYLGKRRPLTAVGAHKFVKDLNDEERSLLLTAISKKNEIKAKKAATVAPSLASGDPYPTNHELFKLGVHASLPFIGFGFLDNLIIIVAGEYIDSTIGASLAISTMAAAALGNALSDVFGVGSAWYVEHWAGKFGINPPNLTLEQLDLRSSR